MALSPDEIERRRFSLAASGYDPVEVDAFLFEVAATLRVARHSTQPPATDVAAARATSPDPFDRAAGEIAELLRAAHETVASIHARAEADAAEIRTDADTDARETRRKADADAAWQQDRAKRVLTTAQEQANAIVAEAEAQARAIVATANEQAEQRVKQLSERAERHTQDVLRAERLALSRLHQAHADVGRAIDVIARGENRPFVDVRNAPADVRFGVPADATGEPTDVGAATGDRAPSGVADAPPEPDEATARELAERDPMLAMVRLAVGRAVDAARDGEPTAATTPPPAPRAAADDAPAAGSVHDRSEPVLPAT